MPRLKTTFLGLLALAVSAMAALADADSLRVAPDSWFQHLAIEVPGEGTSNEWLEPVSDEDYSKLQ